MRVLLVTWYFPPHNDVAALRTGALADYLTGGGNQVHVLTASRASSDDSLHVPITSDQITRTPWFDVDTWSVQPGKETVSNRPPHPSERPQATRRTSLRSILGFHYRSLVRLPDRQVGWLPYLIRAGSKILASRKFDLILASGPPFTTFLGARALARKFSVPWFAEYRDAWFEDFYPTRPAWRPWIDRRLENWTLVSARGIVAVSEPWAEHFAHRFGKPTAAIYNGFDPSISSSRTPRISSPSAPLTITYAGSLYGGKRDPSCLYRAIKLSKLTPADLQVCYYGPTQDDVLPLADKFGVVDFVRLSARVPYAQSLAIQRESDVLLLLQPAEDKANVPAKFFEYVAARRPILGIGLDSGIPARIIRDRCAGLYVTDAGRVAEQLKSWVAQKRRDGQIPDLPESTRTGFSRGEQLERLVNFLKSTLVSVRETQSR